MKKQTLLMAVWFATLIAAPAAAMQGHDSHGSAQSQEKAADSSGDHGGHGTDMHGGTFKHEDTVDGMHATFEVMSLASMNMTSDKGDTHHIMVNLSEAEGGEPVTEAIGKIKVIGPDGQEQISALQNYSGILAANFTFAEAGKYGVICLVQHQAQQRVFKFWYHHM